MLNLSLRGIFPYRWLMLVVLLVSCAAQAQIALRGSPSTATVLTGVGVSPTYHSATSGTVNTATALTLNRPSGATAGNLLIAQIAVRSSATITPPAGWTLIDSRLSDNLRQSVYWRAVTAGEPTSYTWNFSASVRAAGGILRFSGIDTDNPIDAAGGQTGSSTTITAPSQNQTVPNAMLVALYGSATATTHGNTTDMTERYDVNTGAGPNGATVSAKTQLDATVGMTGNKTASTGNAAHVGQLVVLRPSAGLTIDVPTGTVADDTMIATIVYRPCSATSGGACTTTITPPGGWTLVRGIDTTTGGDTNGYGSRMFVYRRLATAGEPDSYTWTFGGALPHDGAVGSILSFSGVDTEDPIVAEAGQATPIWRDNNRQHRTPNIYVDAESSVMLVSAHNVNSSGSWTPPTGMTERVDIASRPLTNDLGISLEVNTQSRTSGGITGTRLATLSNPPTGDTGSAHLLALRPGVSLNCFTESFTGADGDSPSSNWTLTTSRGAFGVPRIFNNRLRLTDASGNVATAAHLMKWFPGAGNKIIVEFDYFAYNGSGADGIALTFSDASITPQAGGYGGSLGYAQRTGVNGFAGGWLGIGIDEYGDFSNPTEGRSGGPGFRRDSISIRGSGSGTTGYRYHTGTNTLTPGVDQPGATPGPGHRYRVTIDHSNDSNAWVTVERKTDSGYVTIIPQYDAKTQTGQADVPTNWMLSYTGSTGGSTNIHEIDDLSVCTINPIIDASGPHHIRIEHSGSGVTCAPTTLTIKACANADCSTPYTGGVTGTLTAAGGPTANWLGGAGFTIGPSGTTTKQVQVTTVGTVTWGTTGITPAAGNPTSCRVGAASTCAFTSALAGFIFDVPNHYADVEQEITIRAVRQADNSLECRPAFGNAGKTLSFACSYGNPASGTLPVIVDGDEIACGTPAGVNLSFDADGIATTTVRYADAGLMNLTASYVGSGSEAGLVMTGSDPFIAAPTSFAVAPSGPYVAGEAFGATVTARNASGNPMPNFGRESTPAGVTLTHALTGPLGGYPGSFSGSVGAFSGGAASGSNLVWNEVGDIDVIATLTGASYLGSGLSATGSGSAGPFRPAYFETEVTPAAGTFSYSGQPFTVKVTAMSASGTVTQNYQGAYAKLVTLTDANSATNNSGTLGGFNGTDTIAAGEFSAGVATVTDVAYTFTSKTSGPLEVTPLALRATDADGATSFGHDEGTTRIRSGRLLLSNAIGSEHLGLTMPVQVQYWNGSVWATNTLDSTTDLSGFIVTNASPCTVPTGGALTGGRGNLAFAAPSGKCTVEVCIHLAADANNPVTACQGAAPANAPAWLQGSWDGDGSFNDNPSASATFGVFKQRAPVIYRRERY